MWKRTEQHLHRDGLLTHLPAERRAPPRADSVAGIADGHRLDPAYPLAWLWARCWCSGLDGALAAGADPASSRALALRAARLARPCERERTAAALEGAIADAVDPPRCLTARVPVERAQVLSARPFLERLVLELRASQRARSQGLARARLIVADGGGPLYVPDYAGALARLAWRASDVLERSDRQQA